MEVYRHICEVDVGAEGVKGAKNFFEAKVPFFTYIQLLAQQVETMCVTVYMHVHLLNMHCWLENSNQPTIVNVITLIVAYFWNFKFCS